MINFCMKIVGLNKYDCIKNFFTRKVTDGFIVNEEHLRLLGIKDLVEGVDVFGMPSFCPISTIMNSNYDAVELMYQNPLNEFQSVFAVRKGDFCGLINSLGVHITPIHYDVIVSPIASSKPVFCVNRNHQWGAIDIFGKEIVPFNTYRYMWGFCHDLCLVSTKSDRFKYRAVIDLNNQFVIRPEEFLDIWDFRTRASNSIRVVTKDNQDLMIPISKFSNQNKQSTNVLLGIEKSHYQEYAGTYAQDIMGLSDETIDDAFDGDPGACWNID